MLSKVPSVIVVGTIRNCENVLHKEIKKCLKSLSDVKKVSFFLVESDSDDATVNVLENLKKSVPRFNFVSLGSIKHEFPEQYNRIRHCRNIYVQYLRKLPSDDLHEFVLVLDLDGMNTALSAKSINSCFVRDDWDVVVANQTFGYYDILALRHPDWQIGDWRKDYEFYKKNLVHFKLANNSIWNRFKKNRSLRIAKYLAVYSKMLRIPKNNPWIKVDSGFGGAAFYKSSIFLKFDYTKEFDTTETDHVSLHRKIVREGGSIYINPRFINSHFNTYNLNRIYVIRVIRAFIWSKKSIYQSKLYYNLKKAFKK